MIPHIFCGAGLVVISALQYTPGRLHEDPGEAGRGAVSTGVLAGLGSGDGWVPVDQNVRR